MFVTRNGCAYFVSFRLACTAMPLSQEQIDALKNPRTVIAYQEQNQKAAGTKAWHRYEKYKVATTVAEAKDKKARWQDLTSHFENFWGWNTWTLRVLQ